MSRLAGLAVALTLAAPALAQPGEMRVLPTPHRFEALDERLEQAVQRHGLGVVARASASRGAAARGVKIPGNALIMVFRNDHAVRMLEASVPAGIEAPLRLYVTENADGTATLSYRLPSAVFRPYRHAELDRLAAELDGVLEKIAADAAGR
ncbi:MAG: DUF302 domain-containing protein [Betaproteobacteria bacterium]